MNKVLVIASGFPPQGGGGVTRVHSVVKYLPRFNYQPIVLTLKESYAYPHAIDYSLLEEYDPAVTIFRTRSLEPVGVRSDFKKNLIGFNSTKKSFLNKGMESIKSIIKMFLIPDEKILWMIPAVIEALKVIKRYNIKLIFITTPPHSVSLIGAVINRITGIPFAWDIRDDWVGNEYFNSQYWYISKIESYLESRAVSRAKMLIAVTEESKELLIRKYPNEINKIHFIPNGFDPEILEVSRINQKESNNNLCKFIYSGSLTWRRDLTTFFDVISELNDDGNLKGRISVEFIGSVHQTHIEYINYLGIEDLVSIHGHLPHHDSIRKLVDADVCILVSTNEEGAKTVIPSKVYEYIALKKFIFALAERDSAVSKLMVNQHLGVVIPPSDSIAIRSGIESILSAFQNGALDVQISDELISKFNRVNLTETLAASFNQLIQ